ncbi:double zinc ribbon domain-containing protein, partial [Salmonella enterica]
MTTPLRCLFCSQVNPPEAIFCTGCDAQLDLQPCSHCDAVDSR